MFGFGFGEILFLAAVALIALGPKQLPEVARTLGKFINEARRVTNDFTRAIVDARDATNEKRTVEKDQAAATQSPPSHSVPSDGVGGHSPSMASPTPGAHEPDEEERRQLSFDLSKDN